MNKTNITVHSVSIPIEFDRFIPPDLEKAFDYFPSYQAAGGPLPFGGYVCAIMKEIDKARLACCLN